MGKADAKRNGAANQGEPADTASLDKVRDILFGKQARQSEKRFDGIEKRLSREIETLRKDQEKTIAGLRAEMDKRFGEFGEAMVNEKTERLEQVRAVESGLTGRLAELESSSAAAHEKLQAELQQQTQAVREELAEAEQRQAEALDEAMTQMRSELMDRQKLSTMLRGLAESLGGKG